MNAKVGGVKKKAPSRTFGMSSMHKALNDIMNDSQMDTDIKKTRKKVPTQPRREPSIRAQTLAKKKIVAQVVSQPIMQKKKKPIKPKLPVIKEKTLSIPRQVDYDTIVKRNLSDVISYDNKEEYVEEFTDLFNKHIPRLKAFVHEHAMNKQSPLTDDDVSLTILQLTDDLYFTIRDKLIMINNGLSPRSPI